MGVKAVAVGDRITLSFKDLSDQDTITVVSICRRGMTNLHANPPRYGEDMLYAQRLIGKRLAEKVVLPAPEANILECVVVRIEAAAPVSFWESLRDWWVNRRASLCRSRWLPHSNFRGIFA